MFHPKAERAHQVNASRSKQGFMSSLVGSPNSLFKGGIFKLVPGDKKELLRKVEGDWRGEMVAVDPSSKVKP